MSTTNMDLVTSTPLVTAGPQWANNVEANWLLLDTHDHSAGKGVKVTPAGININLDLPFQGFSATGLLSSEYSSQSATLSSTHQNAVYAVSGNLYFNNGTGTPVQVTSGTSVNVSGVGGISGMGGTTAAVTYNNATKTFTFTQDSGITASLDHGPITIRENILAAQGVTIQSPAALGGSYSLTLPSALPGSTLPISVSATGVLSAAQIIESQIGTAQVTETKLATDSVSTVKIVNSAVTLAKIATRNFVVGATVSVGTTSTATVTLGTSVTITRTGKPLHLFLQSAQTGPVTTSNSGNISISDTASGVGSIGGSLVIFNGTGLTQAVRYEAYKPIGAVLYGVGWPSSSASWIIDDGATGSVTYTLYARTHAANTSITVTNVALIGEEIA